MVNIKKLQNHGVLRPRRGLAVSWAPCVSDQVISLRAHDGECGRAPGPGLQKKIQSQRASERASREGGPEGHELVSERASLRAVREQVSVDVAPVVLGQRGYFPHIGQ